MSTLLNTLLHLLRPRHSISSTTNRCIWWQFVNWDEVAPITWYVDGQIVEA